MGLPFISFFQESAAESVLGTGCQLGRRSLKAWAMHWYVAMLQVWMCSTCRPYNVAISVACSVEFSSAHVVQGLCSTISSCRVMLVAAIGISHLPGHMGRLKAGVMVCLLK